MQQDRRGLASKQVEISNAVLTMVFVPSSSVPKFRCRKGLLACLHLLNFACFMAWGSLYSYTGRMILRADC